MRSTFHLEPVSFQLSFNHSTPNCWQSGRRCNYFRQLAASTVISVSHILSIVLEYSAPTEEARFFYWNPEKDFSCDLYCATLLSFAQKICLIGRENPHHQDPFLSLPCGKLCCAYINFGEHTVVLQTNGSRLIVAACVEHWRCNKSGSYFPAARPYARMYAFSINIHIFVDWETCT